VVRFINANLVAYRINAEKEGQDLATRYGVHAYPTVVITDSSGEEIDRIIGYLPPNEYLVELRRIIGGRDTYAALKKIVAADSTKYEALYKLAKKENWRQGRKQTVALWRKLLAVAPDTSEARAAAAFNLAAVALETEKDSTALVTYLAQKPPVKFARQAYQLLIRQKRKAKDLKGELYWHLALLAYLDSVGLKDVNVLNAYAWRMAELNINLEDALKRVRQAVTLIAPQDSLTKAQVLDTEAEILWKLGRIKEAIVLEQECIKLQPGSSYNVKQLQKFQKADSLAA